MDISERLTDASQEYNRMSKFFNDAQDKLQNNRTKFLQYYSLAIELWMHEMNMDADVKEIQQSMNKKSRSINFKKMFRDFCMERDFQENNQALD